VIRNAVNQHRLYGRLLQSSKACTSPPHPSPAPNFVLIGAPKRGQRYAVLGKLRHQIRLLDAEPQTDEERQAPRDVSAYRGVGTGLRPYPQIREDSWLEYSVSRSTSPLAPETWAGTYTGIYGSFHAIPGLKIHAKGLDLEGADAKIERGGLRGPFVPVLLDVVALDDPLQR